MLNMAKKLLGMKNKLKKSFTMIYEGFVVDSNNEKKSFHISKFTPNVKDAVLFLNRLNSQLSSLSKIIEKEPSVSELRLAEIKLKHNTVFEFLSNETSSLLYNKVDKNYFFIKDFKLITTVISDNKGTIHKLPNIENINPFEIHKVIKESKIS